MERPRPDHEVSNSQRRRATVSEFSECVRCVVVVYCCCWCSTGRTLRPRTMNPRFCDIYTNAECASECACRFCYCVLVDGAARSWARVWISAVARAEVADRAGIDLSLAVQGWVGDVIVWLLSVRTWFFDVCSRELYFCLCVLGSDFCSFFILVVIKFSFVLNVCSVIWFFSNERAVLYQHIYCELNGVCGLMDDELFFSRLKSGSLPQNFKILKLET